MNPYDAIREERARQDAKWGDQSANGDYIWLAVLTEEVGEVAEAVLESNFKHPLFHMTAVEVRAELVQVAAVAVAWLEALDKR